MMRTSKIAVGTKQGEKQLGEMNSGMDYLKGKDPSISKSVSKQENKTKIIKIYKGNSDMLKVLRNNMHIKSYLKLTSPAPQRQSPASLSPQDQIPWEKKDVFMSE